jgi:hypothetical protein
MAENQDISSTTQKFLDIFDIASNVVVLKDGTVSMVLLVSAMNFGLLAEQEQDAIIYSYAAMLNSLNFPIQIVINSKTKDATSYLQLLEDQLKNISSERKKGLIKRYQNFVGQLIKERNVLDKKFYVVIPAMPIEVGMMTPQSVLPSQQSPQLTEEQKTAVIEKAIGILEPRRDHIISQFNRIGLYARQLNTQEIIEIFYNNYNPEAYEGQQITDSQSYSTAVVRAGKAKAPSASEIREQLATKNQLEELAGADNTQTLTNITKQSASENNQPTEAVVPQPTQPQNNENPTQTPTTPTNPSGNTAAPPMPPVAEL